MCLTDKYEIIDKILEANEFGTIIVQLLYIDHEDHKFYIFNTLMDYHAKEKMEREMSVDLKIYKMFHKMIDTKPAQSTVLNVEEIKTLHKKGYISEAQYHKFFALVRKLKIDNVLDDGEQN